MRKPGWKKPRWKYNRKRLAKGLLPLFAPFIFAPVATPVGVPVAKPDANRLKSSLANYKVMQFNQVAFQLYQQLGLQKTGLAFGVFDKALTGYYNMKRQQQVSDKAILTIVDFTKSSNRKRLWVVDMDRQEVLHHTFVAHGRNSGEEFAEHFSNENESYMSSIGFYVTQDTYQGKHGLSLRLNGLDEGFNTNAKDRCIVMHGAEYASEAFIKQAGRLGRSLGCPALPMEEHEDVIKAVQGGTALYIHAAHDAYTSQYLDHLTAMTEMVKEANEKKAALPPSSGLASM